MNDQPLSRRDFGKFATTTAVAGLAMSDAAESAETPPAIAEPHPPADVPTELLLLEVVRQLHPARELSHRDLAFIRSDIRGELRKARIIREVPLNNADEPGFVFATYRGEDS